MRKIFVLYCCIGNKEKAIKAIKNLGHMFTECKAYSLEKLDIDNMKGEDVQKYFDFYVNKIKKYKRTFKSVLDEYICFEIYSDKIKGKQQSQYHLYTYLLQQMGNNIRCSGNPFDDSFSEEKYREFVNKIDTVIKIINKYNKEKNGNISRICIDAIRNPYEAMFLKDKYKAFYLMAVSTEDDDRKERLKELNTEELFNLDKIEYAQKMEKPQEVFYHQNIQGCLECADIHIYNPDVDNGKYYQLTEQLIKYISLMLHPGLVTPTHVERCMQLAYNAKFNSGCLSRQVGAVVTRKDYSIQSIGWNDVPKGQVSCNLRNVNSFCINKDKETFSQYEIENQDFSKALNAIGRQTEGKTCGRYMSYCFKDVYNGLKGDKNQVYTRALHAEENAFLQISKYGGTQVKDGYLFTTASPCELCAKKAYQLGIKYIYYIDRYSGISQKHILTFGTDNNPEMKLFFGAIGQAYLDFYEPRIASKDELELLTGVNVKEIVKGNEESDILEYGDISYNEMIIELKFNGDRNIVESTRTNSATINKDGIKQISRKIIWTGSSYDETRLISEESDSDLSLNETSDGLPYKYNIVIGKERKAGEQLNYKILTSVKDEKNVMEPYLAHMVKNSKIKKDKGNENEDVYEKVISNANVNYTYAIEWKFVKEN